MADANEDGISLGDICRSIKRWIWLVLGITVAVTLVVSLVFGLVINPRSVEYSMSFNLLYPTSESARYPDGSPFYDTDIVSYGFLEEAKASDEEFASFDIAKMLRNNDITLRKTDNGSDKAVYTVTVKAQYFKSSDAAEKFIRAVAQVPVSRMLANAESLNYKLDDAIFKGASFEEKIGLLSTLKSTLLNACDEWIRIYEAAYPVGQLTLADYRSAVYVVYGDSTRKLLEAEFETNGYDGLDLSSAESVEEAIENRKAVLRQELELNEKIIAALEEQQRVMNEASGSSVIIIGQESAEMIASYTRRNAQISYQIETSLTVNNVNNYAKRLEEQFVELQSTAETVADVASIVYAQNTLVSFQTQAVKGDGSTSLIFVVVVAFVVSFLVATFIACVLDARKKNKQRKPQTVLPEAEEQKE